MRSIVLRARFALTNHWRDRARALWVSAVAVGFVAVYRAACAVLCDVSANYVNDVLNSWAGRVGEWAILAGVMSFHVAHVRRKKERQNITPELKHSPRRLRLFTTRTSTEPARPFSRRPRTRHPSHISRRAI